MTLRLLDLARGFLLAFACLTLPMSATSAEKRSVRIDDIGAVRHIGTPAVSPDGRYAAFAFEGRVYVVGTSGEAPRAVTTASSRASEPYWSRDGEALYFLSDRSGSSQAWKLPLDTFGEAVQVTTVARGVETLQFSPDETRLLLTYDDPDEEKAGAGGETHAVEAPPRKEPFVIDRLQFKQDAGEGYLTRRPSDHLYVLDMASGELAQVTRGRYTESDAGWSPDGKQIVFVSNRAEEPDAGYETDLWVVDADGAGDARRLTASDYVKSEPQWSPDGEWIAYLSAVDGVYGITQLTLVPAGGGEPRLLTAGLDRWVQQFEFSQDGEWIYFRYDNHGGQHLARVRVDDGRIERLLDGERNISGFGLDAAGAVVVRASNGNDAAELYRLQGGEVQRLTNLNRELFATLELGEKRKVSFESSDGTIVEAFITTPPDFRKGRRYPTVLDIHGGPVGQFAWGYDFGAQFLAANGYVVVQPNPRGSTGRGQEFVNAIYRTWGVTDYADVIAAVDHAIELGIADPERLAVTGYSYGGYMTNVVITRTDRFKAALSGAGHSLIAANYGHDIYQRWYNWELGPPWEHRDRYDVLSPLLRAGEVQTPTLFIGGRLDWNVPILNAELFYQSLRYRGIDTQLVVYPGAHHGNWDERFDRDYLERMVAWFDRYLR